MGSAKTGSEKTGSAKNLPSGRASKGSAARSGTGSKQTAGKSQAAKGRPAVRQDEYVAVPRLKPEIKTEIWAIVFFAAALLLFLAVYVSGEGVVGAATKDFLVGTTGFGAFTLPFVLMLWGMALVLGKSKRISMSRFFMGFGVFVILISFIHVAGYDGSVKFASFEEYVNAFYKGGGVSNGGLVGAAVGNLFMGTIGRAGACILLLAGGIVLLIVLSGKSFVDFLVRMFVKLDGELAKIKAAGRETESGEDEDYTYEPSPARVRELPPIRETYADVPQKKRKSDKGRILDHVVEAEDEPEYEFEDISEIEPGIRLVDGSRAKTMPSIPSVSERIKPEADTTARILDFHRDSPKDFIKPKEFHKTEAKAEILEEPPQVWETFGEPAPETEEYDIDLTESALAGLAEIGSIPGSMGPAATDMSISVKGIGVEGYTPIAVTTSGEDFVAAGDIKEDEGDKGLVRLERRKEDFDHKDHKEHIEEPVEDGEKEEKPYYLPPVDLLTENTYVPSIGSKAQILENSKKLEDTLKSFHVEAKVVEVCKGPTVTRYELAPGVGVKVSQISKLADDLALNLAATGIRIEAPVPGKSVVGVEIPNDEVQTVFLREVVDDQAFWNFPSKLSFAVGKDIAGNTVIVDIAKMPHLLIAGATGAGKSVCINTIIASILLKSNPDEVRMLMVDPKVVELNVYNGIPHLEIPVVTEPQKAAGALSWAVREMNERYNMFARTGTRDLKGYNATLIEDGEKPLPQIIIIIDELADLMMSCKNEVEQNICRLAQKARAAGIHLIIATQRPSVDVITGLIKANVPSRLAFAVTSGIDSRTILDMVGAEKLLGKGDMLFSPAGLSKPQRIQGAFISDKEVERLVAFIKKENGEAFYDPAKVEHITASSPKEEEEDFGDDADKHLKEAMDFVTEKGKASVSMLQRQFRIGYNRAARLMEELEARGVVGPEDGVKPRKVLIPPMRWGD